MTRKRIGERALTKTEKTHRSRVLLRRCRDLVEDIADGKVRTIKKAKARADEALSADGLPGPGETRNGR